MSILNRISNLKMAPEMSAYCATSLWHEFYLLTSQGCNNRRRGKKVVNVFCHSRFPKCQLEMKTNGQTELCFRIAVSCVREGSEFEGGVGAGRCFAEIIAKVWACC